MSDPLTIELVPGYVFSAAELVTLEKLNALGNPTINLSGNLSTSMIADGGVSTVKLATEALSADATGWEKMEDGYVTTAKLADDNVTADKLSDGAKGGCQQYADGTFAANVYSAPILPEPADYTKGMLVRFKADVVNAGATDLKVGALAAKNLYQGGTHELEAGQIPAGAMVTCVFDGTAFQLAGVTQPSFVSAEIALVTNIAAAHGLGAVPRRVRWVFRCKTTNAGFSPVTLDEIDVQSVAVLVTYGGTGFLTVASTQGADDTNVFLALKNVTPGDGSVGLHCEGKGASGLQQFHPADWVAVCYADL